MQSVPITTNVVSSHCARDEVCPIQQYVIKFVCEMEKISGYLRILQFHVWWKGRILIGHVWLESWTVCSRFQNHTNPEKLTLSVFFSLFISVNLYDGIWMICISRWRHVFSWKKPRCNCVFMYCKFTYSFFLAFSSQYQRMGLLRASAVPPIHWTRNCREIKKESK
jgi:hypothetical protein